MSYRLKTLKKQAEQYEKLYKEAVEKNREREFKLKELWESKLDKIDKIEMGEG